MIVKFFQKSWDFVKGSSENELVVPTHEAMQSAALRIYLEQYMTSLSERGIISLTLTIENAVLAIVNIFRLLHKPKIWIDKKKSFEEWLCKDLWEVSP